MIPGRLDFINYDMGGDGVGYHTANHETKGGAGYRVDGQTATLSWTGQCIPIGGGAPCTNVWYDTSATLDGTVYPTPTTTDFTIGAVQVVGLLQLHRERRDRGNVRAQLDVGLGRRRSGR